MVKIVSFLWYFTLWTFLFFFFLYRKPWAIYCAVHALRYFCSLLTWAPCAVQTLWASAVLLCRVTLRRHPAHTLEPAELLEINPCRREKPGKSEVHTSVLILYFFSGALQWVLPVTSASPRGKLSSRIRCWRQVLWCSCALDGTRDLIFL